MSDFTVISNTNPLYAEIGRLKRDRDALADALKAYLRAGVCNSTDHKLQLRAWEMAHATLAQVRK